MSDQPVWSVVPAKSIAAIEIGGTPARENSHFWALGRNGHPWLSIADMTSSSITATSERITDAGVRHSNAKSVAAGTPLMSFKLSVGRTAIPAIDLYTNEAIAAFHVMPDQVTARWLLHILPRSVAGVVVDIAVKGATLNKKKLALLPIPRPEIAEQRRICEVLDTLDDAIHRSELVITKLEAVKRGLIHDLLTKGIDDNGEIRDPDRHPEQFKQSALGQVPRVWGVRRLSELLSDGPTNGIYKAATDIGAGTLMVGQLAFTADDRVEFARARRARISRSELVMYGLRTGDILVTRVFAVVSGVGRSVLVDSLAEPAVYESNMMRLRVDGVVLPKWLFVAMKQPMARRHLEGRSNASTQASINQVGLGSLPCPVPSSGEQAECIRRIAALEDRLAGEGIALNKLRFLKKGLADDLLTGRVRVAVPASP